MDFVVPDILTRDDVARRQDRLARIISSQIVPRLVTLHGEAPSLFQALPRAPTTEDIAELAHIVLGPETTAASDFICMLRDRGMSMDTLFVELLEPAARHLGELWDREECDFIDVTLGLGRLQRLLSTFNCTIELPALVEQRSALITTMPGEQHSLGVAMVEKFLRAGGWRVISERVSSARELTNIVKTNWVAVVGLTASSKGSLDQLAAIIRDIRARSCNRAIGVLVGGPIFAESPDLVAEIGADATAANAATAVIAAQKLFDMGAQRNWNA